MTVNAAPSAQAGRFLSFFPFSQSLSALHSFAFFVSLYFSLFFLSVFSIFLFLFALFLISLLFMSVFLFLSVFSFFAALSHDPLCKQSFHSTLAPAVLSSGACSIPAGHAYLWIFLQLLKYGKCQIATNMASIIVIIVACMSNNAVLLPRLLPVTSTVTSTVLLPVT